MGREGKKSGKKSKKAQQKEPVENKSKEKKQNTDKAQSTPHAVPSATPAPSQKSKFWKGFWIAFGVMMGLLVLFLLGWMSIRALDKMATPSYTDTEQTAEIKDIDYENAQYGIGLKLPLRWKDYIQKTDHSGNDYNTVSLDFYLKSDEPTKTDSTSDIAGYEMVMTISVFSLSDWEKFKNDIENGELPGPLGEAIGRNDEYVFIYYPADGGVVEISDKLKGELEQVKASFFTFTPTQKVAKETQTQADLEMQKRQKIYKNKAIEYWNCAYNYTLFYPLSWTNGGATKDSKDIMLLGDDMIVTVEATPKSGSNETLDQFAKRKENLIEGALSNSHDKERYGARIIAYQLTNPNSVLVFWEEGDNFMEFYLRGNGMANNMEMVTHFVGTIIFNKTNKSCIDDKANVTGEFNCNTWVHPNGDVEYWWWDISQKERDCYVRRYNYDPTNNLVRPNTATVSNSFDCDNWVHPNGDVEYWWWDISDEERACFIYRYGYDPSYSWETYGPSDVPYCDYDNDPDCWPAGEFPGDGGDYTPDFDCNNWTHPNGDVEYWWWEVSEAERDCYIYKYGYDPSYSFGYDDAGGDVPYCDYENDPDCWPDEWW